MVRTKSAIFIVLLFSVASHGDSSNADFQWLPQGEYVYICSLNGPIEFGNNSNRLKEHALRAVFTATDIQDLPTFIHSAAQRIDAGVRLVVVADSSDTGKLEKSMSRRAARVGRMYSYGFVAGDGAHFYLQRREVFIRVELSQPASHVIESAIKSGCLEDMEGLQGKRVFNVSNVSRPWFVVMGEDGLSIYLTNNIKALSELTSVLSGQAPGYVELDVTSLIENAVSKQSSGWMVFNKRAQLDVISWHVAEHGGNSFVEDYINRLRDGMLFSIMTVVENDGLHLNYLERYSDESAAQTGLRSKNSNPYGSAGSGSPNIYSRQYSNIEWKQQYESIEGTLVFGEELTQAIAEYYEEKKVQAALREKQNRPRN